MSFKYAAVNRKLTSLIKKAMTIPMTLAHAIKKPLMLILFSFLLSGFAVSASFAQEVKIITFGDSLTAGLKRDASKNVTCPDGVALEPGRFGDSRMVCYGNGAVNAGGYQTDLATAISDIYFTPKIVNYGFSGMSTDGMLSQRSAVLSSLPGAQYVLILGGANDAVAGISRSTVLSNLTVIVNDVRNRGMIPIITTVTRNTRDAAFDSRSALYADDIRQYAANSNVLLADARAAMLPVWGDFNSGDGLHLGPLGDQTLANLYFQSIGLVGTGAAGKKTSGLIAAYMLLLLNQPP
ncbi:MAG: lysophospholipase L1-like esterase [Arenicella sp.]